MPITYRSSINPVDINPISVAPSNGSPVVAMVSGSFAANVQQLPASTAYFHSSYPGVGDQNIPLSQRSVRSLPAHIWQAIKELIISIIECFSSSYACKLRDAWGCALEETQTIQPPAVKTLKGILKPSIPMAPDTDRVSNDLAIDIRKDKLKLSNSLINIAGIIRGINEKINTDRNELNEFIKDDIITDLSITTSGYPYELDALKEAIYNLVIQGKKKDFTGEFCKAVRADAEYKSSAISQPKWAEDLKAEQKNDHEEELPQDAMKRFLRRSKLLEELFNRFNSGLSKVESSRVEPILHNEWSFQSLKKELSFHLRYNERICNRQDYEFANGVSVLGKPGPKKSERAAARAKKANKVFATYCANTDSIFDGNACGNRLPQRGAVKFNAQGSERVIHSVDASELNVLPDGEEAARDIATDKPHEVNFEPKKKPVKIRKVK